MHILFILDSYSLGNPLYFATDILNPIFSDKYKEKFIFKGIPSFSP